MRSYPAALVVVVCALVPVARADVRSLAPAHDTTLYQDDLGAVSNGAGQHLFAGTTDQGLLRRAVLRFDLTGIPAGSTVNSVTLSMHMSRTVATGAPVALFRVTSDWGEGASHALNEEGAGAPAEAGDATWLHTFYGGSLWNQAGGDFVVDASASVLVGGIGDYTWTSAGMVEDVTEWLSSPNANFGWMIIGDETPGGSATAKRFDSRENANRVFWPTLTVDYTTIPAPGHGAVVLGLALLTGRRSRGGSSLRPS